MMARHTQAARLQQETPFQKRKRTRQLIARLKVAHPDAHCSLNYANPLELLVATVLSAQCTDERVNRVTESLFKKYRTAGDYVAAPPGQLEEDIKSTGFYRNKGQGSACLLCRACGALRWGSAVEHGCASATSGSRTKNRQRYFG